MNIEFKYFFTLILLRFGLLSKTQSFFLFFFSSQSVCLAGVLYVSTVLAADRRYPDGGQLPESPTRDASGTLFRQGRLEKQGLSCGRHRHPARRQPSPRREHELRACDQQGRRRGWSCRGSSIHRGGGIIIYHPVEEQLGNKHYPRAGW